MGNTQLLLIEGPSQSQNSPEPDYALEETLKETEEKLKVSEEENKRLSAQLKLLKKEQQNEVDKMKLNDLRDDHEHLKKTVTASNERFENKFSHYKSKVSAQEKKINRHKEFSVSLTNDLYGKSDNTTAAIEELEEDVGVLTKWMKETKQSSHDIRVEWESDPKFELPREAVARRLKEQREAREAQHAEAHFPTTLHVMTHMRPN
ncbi:carboxylesterase family [Fusarium sporotrichioides]|uniref:Carboxylesterase family n=1 Tax=Fusarium sporotrichioides TaxID=5514 RepID=A0A395SAB4_FUSSP|nr:carboxylesterase family [Fusarium sporotrichioides]